jgi:hypothetical protein
MYSFIVLMYMCKENLSRKSRIGNARVGIWGKRGVPEGRWIDAIFFLRSHKHAVLLKINQN